MNWNLGYPIVEFKDNGLFFIWFLGDEIGKKNNEYPLEYPIVAFKFFGKEEREEAEGLYPIVEFNKFDLLLLFGFWSLKEDKK